jgi:hypothetical protein
MGFKTEHRQPAFVAKNGGFLEVLGGYQNMTARPADRRFPMLVNENAHVSLVATTFMSRKYPVAIREKRGTRVTTIRNDELPRRHAGHPGANYTVPLYNRYQPRDDGITRPESTATGPGTE